MQSEGSYCFKKCSPVCRVQGKHLASANSPASALACLVAAEGGCVAETFPLQLGGKTPVPPLSLYRVCRVWLLQPRGLCFSAQVSLELEFGSKSIKKPL